MKNLNQKIGIYQLTNIVNNKIYIGKSINLPRRLKGKEYGKTQLIAKAIKKYGWKNFSVKILESFDSIDNLTLLEKESEWILKLKATDQEIGYNLASLSMDKTGIICSEETKHKISLANKGKRTGKNNPRFGIKHSEESLLKMKKSRSMEAKINIAIGNKNKGLVPVKQIDISTGDIIKIWPSILEVYTRLNLGRRSSLISSVCSGAKNKKGYPYRSAYGYRWEYA